MNSREGGTLLVGVADDGTVHGLDADYASRSEDDKNPRDWFQQHLANIISAAMGDAAATNVRPYLHHVDGHDICRVHVLPSGVPVEATVTVDTKAGREKKTAFYVRVLNGTREITDETERDRYIAGRWPAGGTTS